MKLSNRTLDEKMRIDRELAEMDKHPIDYSDIPPMTEDEMKSGHFGHEEFLRKLPTDILKEMARRRLAEIRAAGYEIPEHAQAR
ncbi:hypothetical protein FACS1894109_10180 [Spirochaetia bacterium]|nr:hypothetical protein FACS1894109_10180 [Spirochaetia bacterium]